jgi:fucose permease
LRDKIWKQGPHLVNPALLSARRSVAVSFLLYGVVAGTLASRLPLLKAHLSLSTEQLSVALFAQPVGVLVATQLVGALASRVSSAHLLRVVTPAATISLIALAFASNLSELAGVFFFYGLCLGAWDVGMNIQGVGVERGFRRPIMASLHGMYSVGILVGTLCGAVAEGLQIAPRPQFVAVASCVTATSCFGMTSLLRRGMDNAPTLRPGVSGPGKLSAVRQPALIATGLIAFCCLFAEGTVSSWSGIFLHEVRHVSYAVAPIGASAAALGMALARFVGDGVIARVGRRRALQVTSVVAAAGLVVAVSIPSAVIAIAGFGIFGLTEACNVPITFTLAGNIPGTNPTWAISRVSTAGYGGLLSSPAVIGFVAQAAGLGLAMLVPVGLLLSIGPVSRFVAPVRGPVLPADGVD